MMNKCIHKAVYIILHAWKISNKRTPCGVTYITSYATYVSSKIVNVIILNIVVFASTRASKNEKIVHWVILVCSIST
jgi:hypothetical protein